MIQRFLPLALCFCAACASESTAPDGTKRAAALKSPLTGAKRADALIEKGEKHFAHLWQVTFGGQNAEGYWDFAGDRLSFQHTNDDARHPPTWSCDRIFATDPAGGPPQQISSGKGVTTCPYFLPGDREVLFSSTQQWQSDCPPRPDPSKGYTWSLHPEYDIFVKNLDTQAERKLTDVWGYDAEATISPLGDRIVFTSSRSGDIELWTCALDGSDLKQVTHELGYDGGAYFSHDGRKLVWRRTQFAANKRAEQEADYRDLLNQWLVRPTTLEIFVANADGSERTQVTHLGGANWAPYFFVGDRRIVFTTNSNSKDPRKFDLFAVDVDGTNVEQITTCPEFDAFPMFSPDGRFLAFASNRGGSVPGETNLFVAQWQ